MTVAPTNRIYLSDVLLVLEVYGGAESLKSHARMFEDKFLISQYNNTEQVALTRHNGANIVEHDLPVHQNQCRKFFGRSPRFRLRRKIIYVAFQTRSPLVGGGYIPSAREGHRNTCDRNILIRITESRSEGIFFISIDLRKKE